MTRAIAIVAPPYRESTGGRVVLHRLCEVLLSAGVPAYMVPWMCAIDVFRESMPQRMPLAPFPRKDDVVIYPDIVRGNPYDSARVVRWQLYHPRHPVTKTDRVYYYAPLFGPGPFLRVTQPHLDLFQYNAGPRRGGTAWTWRKAEKQGWAKHEMPRGGIEVRKGAGNQELASVFRNCDTFVTYDNATFLAIQARLCGAVVEFRSKTPVNPELARLCALEPRDLRAHLKNECAREDTAAIQTCLELLEWK